MEAGRHRTIRVCLMQLNIHLVCVVENALS